ncbi:MAG TPA: adenosine kinase [Hyphomonadaceae bacterium]|nr:adenosine kinase [Hyphomonadaceae bacterium]HPN06218.1 adenosine kinase [Hyphomonadaceae bacterium]
MPVKYDVVALGNAIMDVIAQVDDDFLVKHEIPKARTNLISPERCDYLYNALPASRLETSGGSAGNTVAGLMSLGGKAAFMGKVADDQIGSAYVADMQAIGADFFGSPLKGGLTTARSMIAVTPDGERSMNTFLGASTEFAANDVDSRAVAASEWLYLEGYLFDKPAAKTAFTHASEVAKAAGRKVAITMSDVFCVDRHRESFVHLIRTHCDLVFANEAELLAIYQTDNFDEAVNQIRNDSQIAAITRSSKGSVIVSGADTWTAPVTAAAVVDATGAGDQYAAGVLYAITHGLSLQEAARLGNLCAGEVISHIGPRPAVNLRELAAGLKV